MIPCSPDFLKALKNPIKTMFVKFELYDNKMNFVTEISKQVTNEDVGKISVDTTRAIRRSFYFKLSKVDTTFTWGDSSNDLIWIDKYVKLKIGLLLANGLVEYIPQGVFVVSEPSDTHTIEKKKRLHITGQDKFFRYSDKRGKFVNSTTISKGTNIATAIQTIMSTNGNETLFNFDKVTTTLPYDVTYTANENIYNAVKQLADLAICDIYYDVNGYLRLKQINLDEYAQYPPVWSFDFTDPNEKFYAGNERTLDETNLANHIRVIGGSSQTNTISYDLVVDEDTPFTIENTIEGTLFDGTFTTTAISDSGLTLSQYGTNFTKTLQVQADWQTGTLTNVTATTDGYLSLPTENAIVFSSTLVSDNTITNAYYYNDIWNNGVGINSGDKLVYDVYLIGSQYLCGLDGYVPGVGALKSTAIKDQNNLSINPATDLNGKANNQWYHREFDLSSLNGKAITSLQLAFENDTQGNYTSYFKNIFIKDSNGNIKASIFDGAKDVINTNTLSVVSDPTIITIAITPSTNGGSTTNYTNIGITSMPIATQLTGNRISPIYDLFNVNLYSNSKVTWGNYNYTNSTITIEYRLSLDGGNTWGTWTSMTNGIGLTNLTQGTNLNNYKIQFRQTLTTTDITAVPKISNFQANINSEYRASGTFLSKIFKLTDLQTSATGITNINVVSDIPYNTSMTITMNVSSDGGNTWSGWTNINNGSTIPQITNNTSDLSQIQLQYQVIMSNNDATRTPTLMSISFNADSNLWKGNPYSIQRIGRITYGHNNFNPDPVLSTQSDLRNRAKYELMRRLGFIEQLNLWSSPHFLFEGNDFIYVNDPTNGTNGNYRITGFNLPIQPMLMDIQCLKYHTVINSWNF